MEEKKKQMTEGFIKNLKFVEWKEKLSGLVNVVAENCRWVNCHRGW